MHQVQFEERRFWHRQHRRPVRVAVAFTIWPAVAIIAFGIVLRSSPLVLVLSAVFAWLAISEWLTDASVLVDAGDGFIQRRDRVLGIILVEKHISLDEVARLEVRKGSSPWWSWLMLGFGPDDIQNELVAKTADGEAIRLWGYGLGDSDDALDDGLGLSEWLGLPLRDNILGNEQDIASGGDDYTERLAKMTVQDLPARPTGALANCEVGREIIIHPPRPRLSTRHLFWLMIVPPQIAGLAVLMALGAFRSLDYWPLWALFGGGLMFGFLLRSLVKALRRHETLTITPDGLVCHLQRGGIVQEYEIEAETIRDVTVVRNAGQVDTDALWLGRPAVCIFSKNRSVAFGMGLPWEELIWIKEVIDWTLLGKPMQNVAQAAAGHGRRTIAPSEGQPQSGSMFPQPPGQSPIRRSVRISWSVLGCYLVIMAGVTLTWLVMR